LQLQYQVHHSSLPVCPLRIVPLREQDHKDDLAKGGPMPVTYMEEFLEFV
jgi:hypothetical protein